MAFSFSTHAIKVFRKFRSPLSQHGRPTKRLAAMLTTGTEQLMCALALGCTAIQACHVGLDTSSQAGTTKVAVGQMTCTSNRHDNFSICERLAKVHCLYITRDYSVLVQLTSVCVLDSTATVQDAVAQGCKMLFLPECFSFIGRSPAEVS